MTPSSKVRKKWSTEKTGESSNQLEHSPSTNKKTLHSCNSVKLGDRRGNYLLVGDEDGEYKEYLSEDEVTNETAKVTGQSGSNNKSNQLTTCISDDEAMDITSGVKGYTDQLPPCDGRSNLPPTAICGSSLVTEGKTIDSRVINDSAGHSSDPPKVNNKSTSGNPLARWFGWKSRQVDQPSPGKSEKKKSSKDKKEAVLDSASATNDERRVKDDWPVDAKKCVPDVKKDKWDKKSDKKSKKEVTNEKKSEIVKSKRKTCGKEPGDEDEMVADEKVTQSKLLLPHKMDSTDGLCPSVPSIAVAIGKNAIATHGQAVGSNNRITEQAKQVAQVNKRTHGVIDSRHSPHDREEVHPPPHLHLHRHHHQQQRGQTESESPIKGKKGKNKSDKVSSKFTGKGGKGKGDKGYMKLVTLDSVEREESHQLSSARRQIINDSNTSGDASTAINSSPGPGANNREREGPPVSGRGKGDDNDNEYDEESQTNRTFYDLDPKMYSAKKNIAQGKVQVSLPVHVSITHVFMSMCHT